MPRPAAGSWRSTFVATMLLTTLVLVALIALQAQEAAASHRRAAEAVLRDYARLAAGEYARHLMVEVGFAGYLPIITFLRSPGEDAAGLPSPEMAAAAADPKLRSAAELVRTFFSLGPEGEMESSGAAMDSGAKAWIRDELLSAPAPPPGDRQPFRALHGAPGGVSHIVIYTRLGGRTREPGDRFTGFDVALEALGPWLERALDRGPLLPASLSDSRVSNQALAVRLVDSRGAELFRRGDPEANPLAIESPVGDGYGGIFEGMTIHAAIDPGAAPGLLIGGIPRSTLPVPLVLLALTAGLVGASIYLMRRERALATLRSDFVARVSHELRTPLTQIRMFAETLLLQRVRSDEERRRSLEILDQEARRLSHLVENILQFSRRERGSMRLAPRLTRLAPLVRETVEMFAPLARSRRTRVVTDLDEWTAGHFDPEAMRQILLNLLDNALKYGPAGQEIRITLRGTPERTTLAVEDEGPGIPEKHRRRIWDSFHRLPREETSAVAGTGIGLTVVRDLAALQGGRARVEAADSCGARFVIEFPAREAPA